MMKEELFPVGRVAGPEDVVDREDYLDHVVYELLSGQSVMIAGPRRIGKSSVAYEVLRRLEERGCLTGSVDLFFVNTMEDLAIKMMQEVSKHRWGAINAVSRTWKSFWDAFQKVIIRHGKSDLEVTLEFPLHRDTDPHTALYASLELAERLAQKANKRFVFLFDEFQEIDHFGGDAVLKKLRSIFQHQKHCTYLFLGSKPSMLKTIFSNRRQAFYRFAVQRDLPPVPRHAWEEYLIRKYRQVNKTITPAALALLLDETGGHPHSVMQVANHAHFASSLYGLSTINADLIALSIAKTIETMHTAYEEQWEEIRTVRNAAEIAFTIAQGGRPYAIGLDAGRVSRVIRFLQNNAIIEKKERGTYSFVEPLFAKWVKENINK